MYKSVCLLAASVAGLGLLAASAQNGQPGAGPGPQLSGATAKLFGDNQTFSATLQIQTSDSAGHNASLAGVLIFDAGKSRFQVDMSDSKSAQMTPQTAAQMKALGMDQVIAINRPDKKVAYLIFPGLQSYVESDLSGTESSESTNHDYKVETVKLGNETVSGHDCVKNKVTLTDQDGHSHEFMVWNAPGLKKFPLKIQTVAENSSVIMLFGNITLAKPEAALFEAPSGYAKYPNQQTMYQQQVLKRVGAAGAPPPPGQPGQ
jgi:hypothetical protein